MGTVEAKGARLYLRQVGSAFDAGELLGEPGVFAFDSLGEENSSLVLLGSKVRDCALE